MSGSIGDNVFRASGVIAAAAAGRTGTVDWQTDSIKTATFTATSAEGYFVNTTGGAITVNLPAGSAGDIVGLKDYANEDFLLLTGDPAIIGVACSIVSDMTNGKFNLLKWDKQERKYYPIHINLFEKGEIDESN